MFKLKKLQNKWKSILLGMIPYLIVFSNNQNQALFTLIHLFYVIWPLYVDVDLYVMNVTH